MIHNCLNPLDSSFDLENLDKILKEEGDKAKTFKFRTFLSACETLARSQGIIK